MKSYQIYLVVVAFFVGGLGVMPAWSADIDELVNIAITTNPELKASSARWEMFTQKALQAGVLDDPMIMLKAQNVLIRDPLDFSRENMTSKLIGVSQSLPYFGKRALRREIAEHDAEASRWEFEERKLQLEQLVKETWYRIFLVDRTLETVTDSIGTLDELNKFAETKYATGDGLQQDVLKAQLQRSRMEDMLISLKQQRRSLVAALNVLLYRSSDTPIDTTPQITLTTVSLNTDSLERLAEQNRPRLKSLNEQIEKAKTSQKLAAKEFFPDFTLSFEYMQREPVMGSEGYDMYSAGITFNLPVQQERRHAMVAEADAGLRMSQEELNMERNQIREGITDSLARLERSMKLADLYHNGILPQASHALEASLAAYRVGKSEFMNVLDSQMSLFSYEREYYDAVAEHQIQLARVEGLVGTKLPPDGNAITTTNSLSDGRGTP